MKSTYSLQGMHCAACVARTTRALLAIPGIRNVQVDLASASASFDSDTAIPLSSLQEAVATAGKYTITSFQKRPVFWPKTKRLAPLIGMLLLVMVFATVKNWPVTSPSHLAHAWMLDFMAGFFLLFGGLKIINIQSFARMYATYDVIAKKVISWGYFYAVLEVTLGVLYLTRTELLWSSVATILLIGVATVGVYQKLRKKEEITCACLGGFFNVPITWLTFAENLLMVGMAAMTILFY